MKKVISLLFMFLSIGLIFTSCNDDDDDYYYPIDNNNNNNNNPLLYEVNNVSFNYDSSANTYLFQSKFKFKLYKGVNVLIYLLSDWDNNEPVWMLLPNSALYTASDNKTYNMFFNYNFTNKDYQITAWSDPMPQYLTGITFRVVAIPGFFPKSKSATPPVDYRDYNAVVKYFNIDESKVKVIKP